MNLLEHNVNKELFSGVQKKENIINQYFDNVYVINLDKSTKRMKYMKELLDNENIKYERFNAIYGKNLSKEFIDNITTIKCKNLCPVNLIGCALSHISVWKDILDKNYNNSLILEDDIYFDNNYKDNLKKSLNELPNDWDILYLGCGGMCNKKNNNDFLYYMFNIIFYNKINKKNINKKYIFVPEFPTGMFSYAISKNGCIKLLNIINKISYHIDYQISLNHKFINIYAVYPKCIYPNTDTSEISNNKSPYTLNNILTNFEDINKIKYSWYLNLNLYEFKGIPFNSWSIVFIIFGLLAYYQKNILYLVVLLFIIELLFYNKSYLYNLLYFIIGIFIGLVSYKIIKNNKIKLSKYLIIHTLGFIFGLILLYNGIKNKLLGYLIPGILWFITNIIFLLYGEKVFNKYIGSKSTLFPLLFMIILVFIIGLFVLYTTYKYNNQIIRLLVLIIIIVDLIHLYKYNKNFFIVTIITLLFIIYIIRKFNKVHYDDLTPLIETNYIYLDKSNIIFIIPKYNNIPLTNYPDFIDKIKKYSKINNKELAMHGVTHSPEGFISTAEFGYPLTFEYIKEGIDIFESAFGYKPKKFKAPCYNLHPKNKEILEKLNIEIIDVDSLLLNKLYHNDNTILLYYFNLFNNII